MSFRKHYLVVVIAILSFSLSQADVWVFVNDLPGADANVGKTIIGYCRTEGLNTHELSSLDLNRETLKKISNESILVLTECGILPVEAAPALDGYLSKGGKLVSLGGTLFRKPVTIYKDKWLSEEDFGELTDISTSETVVDYSEINLQNWTRRTTTADCQVIAEIKEDKQKGACLYLSVDSIGDYELLFSPVFSELQSKKYDHISFEAKGGSQTLRMSIVFEDTDGSVWASEIPLTKKWKRYTIPVKSFTLKNPERFQDTLPNGAGRIFDTAKIRRFACGQIRRPDFSDFSNHEFWISQIGLIGTNEGKPQNWDIKFKHRDMLFPAYHSYSCSDVGKIITSRSQQEVMGDVDLSLPNQIKAFHPRCKSAGWNKSHSYRWIPLLEAVSSTGQYRGTIAALQFDNNLEQMRAGFAIEDTSFYLESGTIDFIVDLVQRMLKGNFLWEGGATQFTYFPKQDIRIGAEAIVNHSQDLELKVVVTDNSGQVILTKSAEESPSRLDNSLGMAGSLRENSPYNVKVSLISQEGVLVDQLEHGFWVWKPNENLERVTAKDGEFYLGDNLWHPYGVNYMPSSGAAREPEDMYAFNHWFSSVAYDPDVIERDIAHITDIGMNMVCVFIYIDDIDSTNFIDFLRRCENHKLRINLSLRDAMTVQLDFLAAKVKKVIEKNHLKINNTVFLYDIAWEYRFQAGYYDFPDTTEDWNKWLINKYSTLEKAVEKWSFQPERDTNGLAVPPTHEQWYQSGDWNKMLGDFADFLNTVLHDRFIAARDYIRSIDSHHLVSFRMQYSGDPTFVYPPLVPYDLKGLANAVDVMEPEAYGRVGPCEKVRGGIFTNAYARAVAPKLPVFWPEVGFSVWEPTTMTSPTKLQEEGAAYYRNFLKMLMKSHANGVAFWWYPGGYRTIEKSDYGIINPDGTDRLITHVIREFAQRFMNMKSAPIPEVWIHYPNDWKPGGIVGAYEEIKEEFWLNVDAGKITGLKVE